MGYRNSGTERETHKGQFSGVDPLWEEGADADHCHGYIVEVFETRRHRTSYTYLLQNRSRILHLIDYLDETGGRVLSVQKLTLEIEEAGMSVVGREELDLQKLLVSLDCTDRKGSGHGAGPE